jgi:helix-hairpin-helix protein
MSSCATLGMLLLMAQSSGAAPPAHDLARESQSLKTVCAQCHNLQVVTDTPMSYDAWHDTVQTMIDRGANGTDQQLDDVMDYLHRTLTTIDINTAGVDELQIVLDLPPTVAQAIVARRSTRKFTSLADLKSVPGIDASTVDTKAKLILGFTKE